MQIQFFNADINYILRDKIKIRNWIEKVIKQEGYSLEQLTIIICSDEYLFNLNVSYLKHNTFTDIITFDLSEVKHAIVGELYISIERIKDNSKGLNVTVYNELLRVIIHGVLHLCGYKDKSTKHKHEMTLKEDHYLALLSRMKAK